jgi:iron complex outermembrane receptor protein
MNKGIVLAPLAALLLAGTVLPALADNAIETVIVTAERRPEASIDVPISVTELSGTALHEADVNNALDLQNLSPGLTVVGNLGSSDNAVFSIRGQNQPFGGADPGVQTYFADVPFNASSTGLYYDLDNVQVLEGPQGTLFGRSTTGGAILFDPKRPTDEYEAELDLQGGDFQYGSLEGMVNVPLIGDKLELRVAGEMESRDGYTDVLNWGVRADNLHDDGIRASLAFRPFDNFTSTLMFDGRFDRTHGTGDEITAISQPTTISGATQIATLRAVAEGAYENYECTIAPGPGCFATGMAIGDGAFNSFYTGLQGALAAQQAIGPRAALSTIAPAWKRNDWGITDTSQWDLSANLQLRNIVAYRVSQTQPQYDYDGSAVPLLEITDPRTWQTNSAQLTEELHVQGQSADNLFRWIAGYYYEGDYPAGYSEIGRQEFGGFVNAPLGDTLFEELNSGGTSNAVFAQLDYDASEFVRGLTVTAGARYTWDRKVSNEIECSVDQSGGPCALPVTSPPYVQFYQVAHFAAPDWNLSADYALEDDTKAYLTFRRGYKSGGFNSGSSGFPQFKPEYLTDLEFGVKHSGTLLGVPMRIDGDVYYGWYDNIQKNDFEFGLLGPEVVTFNAAKAHVDGFEMSTDIRPTDGLDLNFFYSYTDASYSKFVTPFSGNHAGDPFAYTPKDKFGVTGRFALPVDPAWGQPAFQVSYYWQSRVWFSDFSDVEPDSSQGAYGLVNMRLDWDSILGSPFDAGVFLDNAANQLYKTGANPLEHLILTTSSMYGPPRMFGLELRYHYN